MLANGISSYTPSQIDIDQVGLSCGKDLEKMAIFYNDSIDVSKFIGYACFWVRKIKPYHNATTTAGNPFKSVNEYFSIWLAKELGEMHWKSHDEPEKCQQFIDNYEAFLADKEFFDYVVMSMKARTFGPHHYVMWLKSLMPSS